MQTNFSREQLEDSATRISEKVLRTCVHCGFCTATCPTYLLLGNELDSPRGRIYLIKDMLEGGKPATENVVKHIDRCLSCLSCMTTCPSGVHYMHLVDHARAHIERTYRRPLHQRLMRGILAWVLPYPARFRSALTAAAIVRPLRKAFAVIPAIGPQIGAMLELAPPFLPRAAQQPDTRVRAPHARAAILGGCAQPVLKPHYNEAATRFLNRHGVEVVNVEGEGCCGALVHHMGREHDALDFARRNVDVWIAEMDGKGLDAIIITASGCGTTIKDYGFMLRNDPAYAEKAARVSALAKDITEYAAALGDLKGTNGKGLTVAYHSACSMQHGQQIRQPPKMLLEMLGFTVREVPEGHICCGSAGTYNILQPKIARRLRDRKIANINKTSPDLIATGNIGCATQIGSGTGIPIVHTIELMDWATGGPAPAGMPDRLLGH